MIKIFVFLSVAIAASFALQCYKCQGNGCNTAPGGYPPVEECPGNVQFCEFQMLNNKKNLMGCADALTTSYPDGYYSVENDDQKKCKNEKGNSIKKCLCTRDKCNIDQHPYSGAGVNNLSGVLIFTTVIGFLLAKM